VLEFFCPHKAKYEKYWIARPRAAPSDVAERAAVFFAVIRYFCRPRALLRKDRRRSAMPNNLRPPALLNRA